MKEWNPRRRPCCRARHCAGTCGPTRNPTTLDEIREKLDNNERKIEANGLKIDNNGREIDAIGRKIDDILENGRKIDAILENVSDLKNNRSKNENYYNEEFYGYGPYGPYYGPSTDDGPKAKSKLLSRKVDTLLENMSDLKTTINNALDGEANQNENNPSTNPKIQLSKSSPRIKPAKNLPH